MLPAISVADIVSRAPVFGTTADPLGQRLISLVFARPSSPVWRDLVTNRAFLDARSGDAWDVFFVGMSAYAPMEPGAEPLDGGRPTPRLYMNRTAFRTVEAFVADEHRDAVARDGRPREAWRFSGETDLVSFMCYSRNPDWLSLRCIRIEEAMTGRPLSLGRLTEGLSRWQTDDPDESLAPGEFVGLRHERYATSLGAALSWSAGAVVGGALGNSAYDLIKLLLR